MRGEVCGFEFLVLGTQTLNILTNGTVSGPAEADNCLTGTCEVGMALAVVEGDLRELQCQVFGSGTWRPISSVQEGIYFFPQEQK